MADDVKTSTGEVTMATLKNAPEQPKSATEAKYHTPHGFKTLQELRELIASKHISFGQLGDDALKALGAPVTLATPKPVPVVTPPKPVPVVPAKTPASVPNVAKPSVVPPVAKAPETPAKVNPFAPKKS